MSDLTDSAVPRLPPPGEISGFGVRLRLWRAGDEAALLRGLSDAEFQRWNTPLVRVRTEEGAAELVRRRREGWERAEMAQFCVVADGDGSGSGGGGGAYGPGGGPYGPDGAILGSVGLGMLDLRQRSGRVGYWVLPEARGHGVARRALEVCTRWAFEQAGLHRIELGHAIGHDASCRIAERCGYRYEGTQRDAMFQEGRLDLFRDVHMHARIATDPAPDPTVTATRAGQGETGQSETGQGQSSSFSHRSGSSSRR
ncbi:GNAT family N-acetyltransferase [Streptomyces sp. AcH 505]|uniref:GNAT family N-acetyltransferase n=1 Tax=Streptomyces sp. AcH 505 TaxID=352211 RepID=UPI0007C68DC6